MSASFNRRSSSGRVSALFPRLHGRKMEVDAFVNAGIDHFRGRIREAAVSASPLASRRIGCGHREGHLVCSKEEGKDTGYGDVVWRRRCLRDRSES